MLSDELTQQLELLVTKTRRRLLLQKLSWVLLLSLVVGASIYWISGAALAGLLVITLPLVIATMLVPLTAAYQNIHSHTLLLHLNRTFSQCEESAQLVLLADDQLNVLQKLQKQRVLPIVGHLLMTDLRSHLPNYPCKKNLLVAAVLIGLFSLFEYTEPFINASTYQPENQDIEKSPVTFPASISIINIQVTPPKYTALPPVQTTEWDIETIAGATITWRVKGVNIKDAAQLTIQIGEQNEIALTQQNEGMFVASSQIEQSAVYTLSHSIGKQKQVLGGLHTLTVNQDRKPSIRFITPTQTITEIPKNGHPQLDSIVQISDDFGLSKVEILASIASGSGEAVKFRDQTFSFDYNEWVDQQPHYYKNWDLIDLGMQPGDELYFSIRAWDNRTDAPQQSRSASKIIRWLEDEQQAVLAEGVLIDFMPEYFKSQRQIIIETEQLIADKSHLTAEQFEQTSRELASAQSFLKQKYGQFLGDEFETGILHTMEAGPDIDHLGHQDHDEHEEDEDHDQHAEEAEEDHPTDAQSATHHHHEPTPEPADNSGYQRIIEQFGHNHGEADDGNFIKRGIPSPKLLMKRALGNMWQAELHLHLSQPELALPFENNALDLLNRAKKAERVYVKRLGFEPPPVSEERRYQGDLRDILSYERQHQHVPEADVNTAFSALLNKLNSQQIYGETPTVDEQTWDLLQQVKAYFSGSLDQQPENIALIATLQNIQQGGRLSLDDCDHCVHELRQKLWQLLPAPVAAPTQSKSPYSYQNPVLQSYKQFLVQQGDEVTP